MSKSNNCPSHRVYAVSKNGERNFWQPIGAAWPHSDNDGFNVKLDVRPLLAADEAEKFDHEAELAAFRLVFSTFIKRLPGKPWAQPLVNGREHGSSPNSRSRARSELWDSTVVRQAPCLV